MILKKKCPTCTKTITSSAIEAIAGIKFIRYQCGHAESIHELAKSDFTDFVTLTGKRPRQYQITGALFVNSANGRALIADDMGIGKTGQACMVLKKHESDMTRAIVICKSKLQIQWSKAIYDWCGTEFLNQIIKDEDEIIWPNSKVIILSYDVLNGSSHARTNKKGEMKLVKKGIQNLEKFIEKIDPQTVILDECQHIKNSESKRTQAVRNVCKYAKYVIALSGTPIKNNAGEYFPILNILYPARFPSIINFHQKYLDVYFNGYSNKVGGLKDVDKFMNDTKDFIIRRTREEVLPDLPKISRDYQFCDLGDAVEQAYKDTLKQFQQYYNYGSTGQTAMERNSNILAYLSKMRHLAGFAKIEPLIEYTEEFLNDTDRKLVIFLHHKDIADTLITRLRALNLTEILYISGGMNNADMDSAIDKFRKNGSHRVIVCSTLAAGEGIDGLQDSCSDCIFLERQWNPANEEQAEGRIVRIGQSAKKLTATYFIAVGTVDEFFSEIVEKKRSIISNALDHTDYKWDQSSLMNELAEVLAITGGKKWGF